MYILYAADITEKASAYDVVISEEGSTVHRFNVPNWEPLVENCSSSAELVYIYFLENGTRSMTTGYYSRYSVEPRYTPVLYGGSYIGSDIQERFNILTEYNTNLMTAEEFIMTRRGEYFRCRIVEQSTTYSRGVPSKMTLKCEIIERNVSVE